MLLALRRCKGTNSADIVNYFKELKYSSLAGFNHSRTNPFVWVTDDLPTIRIQQSVGSYQLSAVSSNRSQFTIDHYSQSRVSNSQFPRWL